MARYVLINSQNEVINAIELEDPRRWPKPSDHELVQTDKGDIGDTWTGGTSFIPHPPPLPTPEQSDKERIRELAAKPTALTPIEIQEMLKLLGKYV